MITVTGEGDPEPQGISLGADGTANVAVFSANASAIALCVFDGADAEQRFLLPARSGDVWHGRFEGLRAGMRYGLRAHGPWQPEAGHRFDPGKLLLDPFAAAIDRRFALHPLLFAATQGDSAGVMPKGVILDAAPPAPARTPVPWQHRFIYELHIRGFSMRHPEIPPAQRGTFAALGHPAAIAHFRALGVTTLEVMPASAWIDERHLPPLGLTNYWGYNPANYLAPDPLLAPGGWPEIRAATDALAAAGIEVLLDVVFNHSGEGDELGPTVSLRGLDNAQYYRLRPDNKALYVNDTGCGNTLALDRPQVVRLAMDALRCWVRRGGIGGFRFDLATTLGRRPDGFDPAAPLLAAIAQDPELRALPLIAEPWDIGPGGYRLGQFPPLWGEWNDRFRDDMRRFWGGRGTAGDLATRLAGSADVFTAARRPSRSINFITAHDGFTLADLVAFQTKHNLANGEANRDGQDDNCSWNNGVEGPTNAAEVIEARKRDQRALLASLLLSRGTPMVAMGSELGHSQNGNNNAYAQDNPISWLDWSSTPADFVALIAAVWRLRQSRLPLHADQWLTDPASSAAGRAGAVVSFWRAADGQPMTGAQWSASGTDTLVVELRPDAAADSVVIAIHRGAAPVVARLPDAPPATAWAVAFAGTPDADHPATGITETILLPARSVLVLTAEAAVRTG